MQAGSLLPSSLPLPFFLPLSLPSKVVPLLSGKNIPHVNLIYLNQLHRPCFHVVILNCLLVTVTFHNILTFARWVRPADRSSIHDPPWFCKEWRVPLNRGIYTAFSYILFITLVIYRMTEPQEPIVYLVDAMLGVFITSYRYLRNIIPLYLVCEYKINLLQPERCWHSLLSLGLGGPKSKSAAVQEEIFHILE